MLELFARAAVCLRAARTCAIWLAGAGRKILKKFGKTLRGSLGKLEKFEKIFLKIWKNSKGELGNVRNKVSGNRTPILLYYWVGNNSS